MLAQLFEAVCQGNEKVGFETYCIAPRQSRDRMLLSALKYYSNEVSPEEIKIIQTAIKELTRLASLRNEIAHGYVSNQTVTENGVKVMEGNYLVSSIDPSGNTVPRGFNLKYAHTAAEIDEWRDKVRIYRGTIIDCYHALIDRRNGGRRD